MPSAGPPAEIVIGVVVRDDGRFLIQPRTGDPALKGVWEMPGGKVHPGEDHHAALVREVAEETGLDVRVDPEPICALGHAYPDRRVDLWAYGCAVLGAGEAPRWARWVTPDEYRMLPMPEANGAIVDAIARRGAS